MSDASTSSADQAEALIKALQGAMAVLRQEMETVAKSHGMRPEGLRLPALHDYMLETILLSPDYRESYHLATLRQAADMPEDVFEKVLKTASSARDACLPIIHALGGDEAELKWLVGRLLPLYPESGRLSGSVRDEESIRLQLVQYFSATE